jgi:hypothetical protein
MSGSRAVLDRDHINGELKGVTRRFAANDLGVGGIELVADGADATYTHDVNTEQSRSRRSRLPFRHGDAGPSSRRRLRLPVFRSNSVA